MHDPMVVMVKLIDAPKQGPDVMAYVLDTRTEFVWTKGFFGILPESDKDGTATVAKLKRYEKSFAEVFGTKHSRIRGRPSITD
jgi:hypothetical protein